MDENQIHGYEPPSKLWKQIRNLAEGYYTLRFAGLFNLPIPLRFAFGIGVSTINRVALCDQQCNQERKRTDISK